MESHRASFSEVDRSVNLPPMPEQLESSSREPHSLPIAERQEDCHSHPGQLATFGTRLPPTPAPSPTPHQRPPNWHSTDEEEHNFLLNLRLHFSTLSNSRKQKFLEGILDVCDSQQLSFVSSYVGPRLRKDPFLVFPNELCLRVLSFIDDPKTLARSSQVSRRWRELLNDDITWKNLCEKHAYSVRRISEENGDVFDSFTAPPIESTLGARPRNGLQRRLTASHEQSTESAPGLPRTLSGEWLPPSSFPSRRRRARPVSYRSQFKQKYMVESAWNKGGRCTQRHITPDQGVVTSLHLTSKYIVVALDNAKIHVYDTDGDNQKTLQGHVMGVWAMVPWDDILAATVKSEYGTCLPGMVLYLILLLSPPTRTTLTLGRAGIHLLRGHTSTVRCLKMSDRNTAISGSRDTTLRIWDLATGTCRNVLVGHQASVRCLAIHGDLVVSGSYDTTARIWSISQGRCLRTLSGHFSQIYAISFDGRRIATGSLDTSVRIWDPHSGQCHAILQGHTSLVGQLQMRGDTLVTGGSDGSVRVWSLTKMAPIHRLAAHDNSVTSLQFDNTRIVSGGSDGRVKVWNLQTGQLLRELSTPAEAVWRVAFEEEKAVIMASRSGRTVMEVWTFSPPDEDDDAVESTSSTPAIGSTSEDPEMTVHTRNRALFSDPTPTLSSDGDQPMPDADVDAPTT
ncbi:F-box and WD repeat-containing protein [Penicillium alfredii]|uniref:Probable E3 ubiquitin ligase complex SCF subunit sconB n=1 Tax=Penicillium alfredii TaxID=1506179 RepID=A0A9W9EHJ9_9EURO|nr:F-box and WD repeat-containing protein [Penicillium alfredii]KAJ5081938.1 F-box and WD repeat-containing protein [Penicillium alfredii]